MNSEEIQIHASYSTLCSSELLRLVVPQYKIANPVSCEFWYRGLTDTYKICTDSGNFALRVYRKGWRSLSDISFEMESIQYLHEKGASVAFPIKRNDGGYITTIIAPEGERQVVITQFVEGGVLKFDDPEDAVIYGRAAADIHILSSGFSSRHNRYELDINHLISEPLNNIKPFLSHRSCDWVFLTDFAENLSRTFMNASSTSGDYSFCHGDFHGANAHDREGEIVHFDFDCCGFGLRVYDLATFKWSARLRKKENEWWPKFLQGYRSKREFSDADLAYVESFVAIRDLWLFGLHTGNASDLAKGWINEAYIDRRINFLKDSWKIIMAEQVNAAG